MAKQKTATKPGERDELAKMVYQALLVRLWDLRDARYDDPALIAALAEYQLATGKNRPPFLS